MNPEISPKIPCYFFCDSSGCGMWDETELPINTFPVECPYSIAQVLDSEFLPDIIDL